VAQFKLTSAAAARRQWMYVDFIFHQNVDDLVVAPFVLEPAAMRGALLPTDLTFHIIRTKRRYQIRQPKGHDKDSNCAKQSLTTVASLIDRCLKTAINIINYCNLLKLFSRPYLSNGRAVVRLSVRQ